jgi:hypothetical protein
MGDINRAPDGFEDITGKKGEELGWDATITNDGADYALLPAGDYDFTVTNFERARHPGSEKLPPCNKAIVHIKVSNGSGETTIKHQLFLHSKMEGMLSAFFRAIGQKKHGEQLKMDWGKIIGRSGRAKIHIDTYENGGKEYKTNKVQRFYDPPEKNYEQGKF